jgi:hypothetical protein
MLKRLFSALLTLTLISVFCSQATHAESAIAATQPAIVITEFSNGMPDFFELYNQSAQAVYLGGIQIHFTIQGSVANQEVLEDFDIMLPDGWLLPKQHLLLQNGGGTDPGVVYYNLESELQDPSVVEVSLVKDSVEQYAISPPLGVATDQYIRHKQRGNATLKMTGTFASDYIVAALPSGKNPSVLYFPPLTAGGLQVVEILPNAQDCSSDGALDCSDYIKLYNSTTSPIDTSLYRLRTSSSGTKSSTANTFKLSGVLQVGEYMLVYQKDSGGNIAVTNTGGNVWLEDQHGTMSYSDTTIVYPDASSTKIKGLSWAFDEANETWRWMQPRPSTANYWSPEVTDQVQAGSTTAVTQDCALGKERNPETNRCRNIVAATVAAPCKAGQERNSSTGRCRSVLASSTVQKACNADQYRNSYTGRCKKIAAASTSVPCKKDQERNPETNRCRKKVIKSKDVPGVQDMRSDSKAQNGGWVFAGIGALAVVGYGVYEWRQDIAIRLSSIKTIRFIRRHK